eukprot:472734_1
MSTQENEDIDLTTDASPVTTTFHFNSIKTNHSYKSGYNAGAINKQQQMSYTLLLKLCLLGFFINFQPSEAYLTPYLKETKGLTDSEIDNNIWPYDTYGSLISLLPIGLCAEHFGFRKIIFFGLICREITRLLLLYGTELWQMSLMQCTYALCNGNISKLGIFILHRWP